MQSCLEKRIEQLLDMRCGGHVEKSRHLFSELCNDLNLNFFKADKEQYKNSYKILTTKVNTASAVEFLLIQSSFHRNSKEYDKAEETLSWIYDVLSENKENINSQYFIQAGLNQIAISNFSKALEMFLKASYFSKNNRDKAIAEINIAISKEELGIDYLENISKVEHLINESQNQIWLDSVIGQYNSMMLRQNYYSGNLSKIFTNFNNTTANEQSLYLGSYLTHLPYINFNSEDYEKKFHQYLQSQGFTYLAEFRLHTLRGLMESEINENEIKASAWIERLYLWTWRYIANPNQSLSARILATINSISNLKYLNLSTAEYCMLTNALDWISLFQPKVSAFAQELISNCNHANTKKPTIFIVEKSIIQACKAKERNELLWKDELKSAELLGTDEISKKIIEFAKNVFNNFDSTSNETVNIHTDGQSFTYNDVRIVSPHITSLLKSFIENNNSLPKSKLFLEIFKINKVDPIIHDPKLANLLSKANKLFSGKLLFQAKGDFVYCQKNISLNYTLNHKGISEFSQKIIFETKKKEQPDNLEKIYSSFLPRKNFELILKKSRASTARLLLDWKQKGLIETQGRGRAILYKANLDLKPIITRNIRGTV